MTRTPHHSKKEKSAVHGLPLTQAAVEVTEAQAREYKVEQNHHYYIRIGNETL